MGFLLPPSRWERDHAGFVARSLAYQVRHDGDLPSTPIWRALEHRFDLNQSRFSFWHPNVARMILRSREEAPVLPTAPCIPIEPPCLPTWPVDPGVPIAPPCPDPGGGSQAVPGPGSLELGVVAVVAFVARRIVGL